MTTGHTEAPGSRRGNRAAQRRAENEPARTRQNGGNWDALRAAWLSQAGSRHTARAYAKAVADFAEYLQATRGLALWQADVRAAQAWREHLQGAGKSQGTVALRLAAVSSFYAFAVERAAEGEDREARRYLDARGCVRPNPFRAPDVDRPKVEKYRHGRPLAAETVQRMMVRINTATPTGARDYALLVTFLYTGWRSSEVLGMRWGDIRESPERPGQYVCHWRGRQGEEEMALPARCYEALVRYLDLVGRSPARLAAGAYLWRPLRTDGCRNFRHVRELALERPITQAQANNILRKRLREAGVEDPGRYSLQSLRYTFAQTYARAKEGDVVGLSRRLHHSSVETTCAYLAALQPAVDDYSAALEQAMPV